MSEKGSVVGVNDLRRLAVEAHLAGEHEKKADALARGYQEALRTGDHGRAAWFAFWSGLEFVETAQQARGQGWFSRAAALVEEHKLDGPERGYVLMPRAFGALGAGDIQSACDLFGEAASVGQRTGDVDLVALARQARGRALIHLGRTAEGVALLDEVMVAVTAGEVSPLAIGTVYCSVIEACKEMYDLRRAQEWTAALSRWCESRSDSVPYRGQCLVYRAELMRLHGAWPDAMEEAERARGLLPDDDPFAGAALYQQAELYRLRGELARAEETFRAATAAGNGAQPGLALLRLGQGQVDVALTSIRRAVEDTNDPLDRSRLLPAYVEIALAARDVATARAAADELVELTARYTLPYLRAIATHADAAVRFAQGDARGAMPALRAAWSGYRELEAPYEAARVRELLGLACRALGDEDAAAMELDAARSVFEQLYARPDAERVQRLATGTRQSSVLTARELEVVALVARGKSNREIATDLVISEKTVARHLSNIFTKLDVPSRSALTAYAYEHRIV